MRYSRSIPAIVAAATLGALAACAASAVTPVPDEEDGGEMDANKPDRGPFDPNPAKDTGSDTNTPVPDGGCLPAEGPSADLVINELDYDTPSPAPEDAEFVEIFNKGAVAKDLTGIEVVFFNGNVSGNKDYKHVPLSGSLGAGKYLVIGSDTFDAGAGINVIPLPRETIQNGPKDAVALIDTATRRVIDSLSYEGALTEPCSFLDGTQEVFARDNNDAGASLARIPNGQDTNKANEDWKLTQTPTPGSANPGR